VRSNFYYQLKGESAENLHFMGIIDKQFLDTPWYGSRPPLRQSTIALPGSEWRVTCSARVTSVAATVCAV
jgi:hypothetical protein